MSKENDQNFTVPEKLWNPMFIGIFIASGFMNLSTQMSNSMLSLYAKSIGAPADQIGTLMSMFALTALGVRFVAGPAMNAYNKTRLLQMAMFLFGTAYLGFSLSPAIAAATGLQLITVLKIFRLIQGCGNAFGNSCLMSLVSEVIPPKQFSSGMAIYALAQTVSQAIGPTVGVALRSALGYNASYIVTSVMMYFSIVLVWLLVHVPNRGTGKFELKLDTMIAKEALVPAVITLLLSIGFTSINSFLLVYAEERGISGGSLYFTVYALVLLATRPFIGKMIDKYGFVKISLPCLLMTAISLVLIGLSSSLPMLLLAGAVNAFGYGAVQPGIQSIGMMSVTPDRRGSASSTNYIAMDAGTLIGPYICGVVANAFGYTPLMWVIMSLFSVAGLLFVIATRKRITQIETDFANRMN